MRFTRDDAQAARDAGFLGKGILKTDSRCASPPTSSAYKLPNPGPHFRNGVSMVLQFPPEILQAVAAYVAPIWLFQLEEAYPILAEFLSTQRANKIWYELLPAALMSEPEYFQDESEVAKILEALHEVGVEDKVTFQLQRESKYKLNGINFFLTNVSRTWSVTKSTIDHTITLPQILRVSPLSRDLHMHFCNHHPHGDDQYPLVTSESRLTRARVLALGGSYDQSISYRREIAGHLHTGRRCYLYLELFRPTQDGDFRSGTRVWGMRWCQDCLGQWTIQSEDIAKLSGLPPLLQKSGDDPAFRSLWVNRFTDPARASWRPHVDDILRKSIGIDFDTAAAKEEYMRQISKALTSNKQPITALRRELRRDIVQIAQTLSTLPNYDNVPANLAKQTFARPTELSTFLFRAGLLDEEKMFEPYDPNETWLSDPTQSPTLSKDVRRKLSDTTWKTQKATEMLDILFNPWGTGAAVTSFEQAASQYHIRRISSSISAHTTIEALNQKFPPQESPFVRTPTYTSADGERTITCHFDVLLAKLYIY